MKTKLDLVKNWILKADNDLKSANKQPRKKGKKGTGKKIYLWKKTAFKRP